METQIRYNDSESLIMIEKPLVHLVKPEYEAVQKLTKGMFISYYQKNNKGRIAINKNNISKLNL